MPEERKSIKLYNVILPVWLLFIIPTIWPIVFIGNYIIDSLVLVLGMKYLAFDNIKAAYKSAIIKSYVFGFLGDALGVLLLIGIFMFISTNFSIEFLGMKTHDNFTEAFMMNSFRNLAAFVLHLLAIVISAVSIYFLNYKYAFNKIEISDREKHKLAIIMAIFTAPYLFLFPAEFMV